MAADDDLTARLGRASQALDATGAVQGNPAVTTWEGEVLAAAGHSLAAVEALTPGVAARVNISEWDAGDRLLSRILLTEARHALSNLRAVTNGIALRVDTAQQLSRETVRFVTRDADRERRRTERLTQRRAELMQADSNG
jgi:hypothetical protein